VPEKYEVQVNLIIFEEIFASDNFSKEKNLSDFEGRWRQWRTEGHIKS
jgi:hypothetical protein